MNQGGAEYGWYLIQEAKINGKKLSIRKAAKMAGCSHTAIILYKNRLIAETTDEKREKRRKKRITYVRTALQMVYRYPCLNCDVAGSFYIMIERNQIIFHCLNCNNENIFDKMIK